MAMKKTVILLMFLLLLSIFGQAARFDDFESYTPGTFINAGGTPWTMVPSWSGAASFQEETSGNNYVDFWGANNGPRGIYRPLGDMSIAASNTATTVFMRVLAETTNTDASFGLSDLATPSVDGSGYPTFPSFEVQAALIGGTIRARNGSAGAVNLAPININTWYNIWLVIDNSTDTYDLYMTTDQTPATGSTPLADNYAFRNGTAANDLITFLAIGALKTNPERVRIDDIYISSGVNLSYPVIPVYAHNPTPASGATGVETSATLSWYTGVDPNDQANVNPNITKHYVYMREGDPNLTYVSPLTITASGNPSDSCNPPLALVLDKTYYWRVDESVNDSGPADANTIKGDVWSFVMQKSVPVITQQPVETRVYTTEPSAVLTCVFSSVSAATATWYRYVDGINDTPLSTGGDIVITTIPVGNEYTSTLQINTPQAADQGNYYCQADNTGGIPVNSNIVALVVKRLLAQYDFDGNLAPAAGSDAGAPTGQSKSVDGITDANSLLAFDVAATYTTGIDNVAGHAIQIDPNLYVDFGPAGYPKADSLINGIGCGMDQGTIICWVKPATVGALLGNFNDGAATGFLLSLAANGTTADARIVVRGDSAVYTEIATVQDRPGRPGWDAFDTAWHLVAATWSESQTMKLYVDGQQVASVTAGNPDGYLAWTRGVLLGAARTGTRVLLNQFLSGAVDNLRIYNYEITADSIAQEYLDVTGIQPCVNSSFAGSEYNFNNTGSSYCKIDLADFAVFAENWLSSGLYGQ